MVISLANGELSVLYPLISLSFIWVALLSSRFLQETLLRTLAQLGVAAELRPPQDGIWGRTGQLVAFGVAVQHWVAYHGAFVNVSPPTGLFRLLNHHPTRSNRVSSLVAERRQPVKMTSVRAELVRQLSEAFGCDRYHLYTGHPLLK